ncbi:MAG TPA: twin-arginine translocase TatA/TatE family subunit [Bryobacteraceae bacterium]|nr:twin-arginine translocase TatA/TatE family subunit [Bryobacteraceae bacterium]
MGTLGVGELAFIFILALLLFGPKKLPELGKTIGKAMTEFRRAQSELKATFDREMSNIERETGVKELTATTYQPDSYSHDYSNYDSSYYDGSYDSTVTTTTTAGASAIEGAGATAPLQIEAAAGSIANGHLEAAQPHAPAPADFVATGHPEPAHAPDAHHSAPGEGAAKPANS